MSAANAADDLFADPIARAMPVRFQLREAPAPTSLPAAILLLTGKAIVGFKWRISSESILSD
jgi:hypothetical protein